METHKSSQLEFLTKCTSRRTRKEDQVRLRALNGLLYKALTDMLCTPEVSQELCDLNVELCKVAKGPCTPSRAWRWERQEGGLVCALRCWEEGMGGRFRQHPVLCRGEADHQRKTWSDEWWPMCLPLRGRTGSWLLPSAPSGWSGFTPGRAEGTEALLGWRGGWSQVRALGASAGGEAGTAFGLVPLS